MIDSYTSIKVFCQQSFDKMEQIPSFYDLESVGYNTLGGTLQNSNVKLRYGEVKREILPTDKDSVSKTYREYEVLVQHYEGGSATHRMYHNCMILSSAADYSFQSLRVSDKPNSFEIGNGSLVLILCIEGNDARGVIIGSPQLHKDLSKKFHKESEFNGVNFQVLDDGSWQITNNGKTDNNGNLDKDADQEGAGTLVNVRANGDFIIKTPDNKCEILVEHKSGKITINSSEKFIIKTSDAAINSDTIKLNSTTTNINSGLVKIGNNASHPAVLGDALAQVLSMAFGLIGPTLPTIPQQAALAAITTQVSTILSSSVKVSG
jgi:hypothetical protein